MEREANATKVIFWDHRRFIEVTYEKYVKSKTEEFEILFQNILEYFDETWTYKPKPYEINEYLKKKYRKSDNEILSADRHVTPQPIEYKSQNGLVRYNRRKIAELPNVLANLNPNLSLIKSCELVFFNYTFMHAKFVCESLNDTLEDLKNIIDEAGKYKINDQAQSALLQLKLYYKLLIMCGTQMSDDPDSYGYQATSRLLYFYGKQKYITNLIDESDMNSKKHCAFVSPCLQQSPVGGFLISSSSIHKESIAQILCSYPYILTYSESKINVFLINQDTNIHLFQIKLPTIKKLNDFLQLKNRNAKKTNNESDFDKINESATMKCILNSYELMNSTVSSLENNADLFPVSFLIIHKNLTYIISASKTIKFVYKTNNEILDVFVLEDRKLILVEKYSKSIKIFPDYEHDLNTYYEYNVCDENGSNYIKQMLTSNNNIIDLTFTKIIDLVFSLDNNEIRQYLIRALSYEKKDEEFDSTSEISSSKSDTLLRTSDNRRPIYSSVESITSSSSSESASSSSEEENYCNNSLNETIKLSDSKLQSVNHILRIVPLKVIKPTGLNIENILKIKDSLYSDGCVEKKFRSGRIYLTTSFNNSFILLKTESSDKRPVCCLFENFTKQPIVTIKSSKYRSANEIFTGAITTKDYLYLIHTSNKNASKKMSLCKLELKENIDFIEVFDKSFYILCRNGIIELYKLKCLSKNHRIKLVFSINTLSPHINDIINIG